MNESIDHSNPHVDRILDVLERGYRPLHPNARFDAYQSTRWSIRIRIVDPDVANLDYFDRDQPVWNLFDALPDDTFQMISILFLLSPEELEESPTNQDFESGLKRIASRQQSRAKRAKAVSETTTGRATEPHPTGLEDNS